MKKFVTLLLAAFSFTAFADADGPTNPADAAQLTKSIVYHRYTADPTVAEAGDFTAVADVAGSLSGTYFYFYSADNAKCYQPWYNVDSVGVAPTAVSGCTLVPVVIATGDTAATVAGNTRTALNTAPYSTYFAITGATTHVIVTSLTKGTASDANIGTSGFAVSKTQGVSGTLAVQLADQKKDLVGWQICNDAVNTSTALYVANVTDPSAGGQSLGKGQCYYCVKCGNQLIGQVKVSAQAATNGYSVQQFRSSP